jgi:superfamily II DNA or RNA helicase
VWHTQGSGKSLTMVFLIRAMRSHPELRRFKIVLVTDRTDLQDQLSDTAALTGETIKVARNANEVKELLSQPGPGVVMAMIQKYRDTDNGGGDGLSGSEAFGTLNESDSILVMVDEAHRSHGSALHANLMNALPNAARIGFTGTPIIMGKRKKTLEIFGGYLDRYTLTESEADGSTVPIFYEGKTTDAAVAGASKMDDVFARWFSGLTDDQRELLQKKYATTAQVLEAPEMIAAKARDILRHYVSTVMPDGFKGMIVATSRKACLRYFDALNAARDELVAEIEAFIAEDDGRPYDQLDVEEQFLRNAAGQLDLLRDLDFAPVISADHNDPPEYHLWSDKLRQQVRINLFKRPLGPVTDKTDPLAILIVKSMLLTGFDAPHAQVLYLDRLIQEAELLQAIARVNRTAPKKSYGLVVDYYGVAGQLTQALAAYTSTDGEIDPDVDGALRPLVAEIAKLDPQRERIRQLFVQRGVDPSADTIEDCILLLEDERLRAEFDVALKQFMTTFDTVLPRPEALPFVEAVNLYGEIQVLTRRRYRDDVNGDFDPHKYKEKVRRLIDQHITVLDLSQRIAPIKVTDAEFAAHVRGIVSPRTKASEMEHAIRHHIREHLDEDPAYYDRLSQRVDEILEKLEDRWEQIALFEEIISEINAGRTDEADTGLDPATELPFHGLMAERVASSDGAAADALTELTRSLVTDVRKPDRSRRVLGEQHQAGRAAQGRQAAWTTATCSPTTTSTNWPSISSRWRRPTGSGCDEHGIHELESLTAGDLVFTIAPPTERTTLEITVDRDASLILRAPTCASRERVERFIESKRPWVYRKLAEKDALVAPPIRKQFVDGEGFAYLGRNYRLKLDDSVDGVRLDRGRFLMSPATAADGDAAMRRWYVRTGQPWLQRRVEPWAKPHGRRRRGTSPCATSATAGAQRRARPTSTSTGRPAARTEPHRLRHRPRTRPPQGAEPHRPLLGRSRPRHARLRTPPRRTHHRRRQDLDLPSCQRSRVADEHLGPVELTEGRIRLHQLLHQERSREPRPQRRRGTARLVSDSDTSPG